MLLSGVAQEEDVLEKKGFPIQRRNHVHLSSGRVNYYLTEMIGFGTDAERDRAHGATIVLGDFGLDVAPFPDGKKASSRRPSLHRQ
jgi:hypothetical protein